MSQKIRNISDIEKTEGGKIPFSFDGVPKFFLENNWLDPKPDGSHFKRSFFISWAFNKCSPYKKTEPHGGYEIVLEPYEFICGRKVGSKETGLTEKEFRGQLELWVRNGFLEKTANSRANHFSCYKWVTSRFSETEGQPKGQPRANPGPTKGHKQDIEIIDYKEQQQPKTVPIKTESKSVVVPLSSKKDESKEVYRSSDERLANMRAELEKKEADREFAKNLKSKEERIREETSKTTSDNISYDYKIDNKANYSTGDSKLHQTKTSELDKKNNKNKNEIYSCLKLLSLTIVDKEMLTQNYSEEECIEGVRFYKSLRKAPDNPTGIIIWAIKKKPQPIEDSKTKEIRERELREKRVEENKMWCKSLLVRLRVDSMYYKSKDTSFEYKHERGFVNIGYAEPGFKEQIESIFRKSGKWIS